MRIDCHVHVVGNGTGGTGCWYRPRGLTRLGAPFMLRAVGLDGSALRGDLDGLYADRLVRYVRESSLDTAVILAHEEAYRENGDKIENSGSFYVPNGHVLTLAARHPELLPAVSIHPARADAMDELARCLDGGAVMLKCLPNVQNIDWGLSRYTRFLERMAESGLILLAHTGSERTMPVAAPELASPRVLTRPLEIGVTCIAAHCGTGLIGLDPDYFDVFAEMVTKHPRLYGDNSALAALTFRLRPSALRRMVSDELRGRILHGSDVPVPVSGAALCALGMLSWRDWRETARIANPLERDAELKRRLGFNEASFTKLAGLLRKTGQVEKRA
ncbi:MAG: amidohydrolase family protein [Verrucomicrobiota bacterium]